MCSCVCVFYACLCVKCVYLVFVNDHEAVTVQWDVKHEGEGDIYYEAVMVQCKEKRKGKKRGGGRVM